VQVVVAAESGGASGGLVRQLSIDQFENEGRRVSYGTPDSTSQARRLLDRQMSISGVQKKVFILCSGPHCTLNTHPFSFCELKQFDGPTITTIQNGMLVMLMSRWKQAGVC
jgi:hypothetical protein